MLFSFSYCSITYNVSFVSLIDPLIIINFVNVLVINNLFTYYFNSISSFAVVSSSNGFGLSLSLMAGSLGFLFFSGVLHVILLLTSANTNRPITA